MAGFDFQLTKAIGAIVRQHVAGRGVTLVEALSDIAEIDEGIVITQAKRTLASSSFHSALAELWDIDTLAREKTPTLAPHLQYRVLSTRRVLQDWKGSLSRWSPEGGDPSALAAFKARVAAEIDVDPRLETARALVHGFKDHRPFARIDEMLGRLVGASEANVDARIDAFRVELDALAEAARDQQLRFGLWGAEDHPPKTVRREADERRAVRLGERLTLADMREGRLAVRSVYGAIETACETWLAGERLPYKLPLFWLAGRSGCGKSAALLHVAARLYAQNPDRIILWLGESVDRVAEAVRWAAPLIRAQRSVILVLDDPFTAARQIAFAQSVEQAQSEWDNIRCHGSEAECEPPVILCCGPTEQRSAAEDICGNHIEFAGYDMPIETNEDLVELAAWYSARTGKPVEPLTGNILLVQQVFEWTKGSIRDFSIRFRTRIRNFDNDEPHGEVFATIAQILALNRLYVDFPAAELDARRRASPTLEAALIQLAGEEAHFVFDPNAGGGVRLTHPHLADAIYTEWFGRLTDRPFRRDHLARALTAAVDQDDERPEVRHAPLWSISRLAQPADRHGRPKDPSLYARIELIRDELVDVLRDVYADRSHSETPLQDLPVWVGLNDELGLALDPDPAALLVRAVDACAVPERGLRLSCHRLLASTGGDAAALQACVAACLTRFAAWRDDGVWHDWAALAIDFIQRADYDAILGAIALLVRSGALVPRMPQLIYNLLQRAPSEESRPIVIDWLQRTPSTEQGWSVIVQRLQAQGHCDESDAIAQRFLQAAPNDPAWAFIWRSMFESGRGDRGALLQRAAMWLGVSARSVAAAPLALPVNVGWDRVWQALFEVSNGRVEERERLGQAGLAWIEASDPAHEGWTRVWVTLWEAADQVALRPRLLGLGETKLDAAPPTLLGWSLVWNAAIKACDRETEPYLLSLAMRWLRAADPDHLGWGFVWQALVQRAAGAMKAALAELAAHWLVRVDPKHQSWPYLWCDHREMTGRQGDQTILDQGFAWLQLVEPGHMGWARIALIILSGKCPIKRATIGGRIRDWLRVHPTHLNIKYATGLWIRTNPARLDRDAVAAEFIALAGDDQQEVGVRCRLWGAVQKLDGFDTELVALARSLLDDERVPHDEKASICASVLRFAKLDDRDYFRRHAQSLMERASADTWPWLWDALARDEKAGKDPALLRSAVPWLLAQEALHREWARTYLFAWYRDKTLVAIPDIQAKAWTWLRRVSAIDKWTKLWRTLIERVESLRDPVIGARSREILEKRRGDAYWSRLWKDVFGLSPAGDRDGLIALAGEWLAQFPDAAGWSLVWKSVHRATAADSTARQEVIALAVRTLSAIPPVQDWSAILVELRAVAPAALDVPGVRTAADCWLSEDAGRAWYPVARWRSKLQPPMWDDAKLVTRATVWLRAEVGRHGGWSIIWQDVCRARPVDETAELQALGLDWLRNTGHDHVGWPYVWLQSWKLQRSAVTRDCLKAFGDAWLASLPDHSPVRGQIAGIVRKMAKSGK